MNKNIRCGRLGMRVVTRNEKDFQNWSFLCVMVIEMFA